MIRILAISHSSSLGGAEKVLALLLEGLRRDKYQPMVLSRPSPLPFLPTDGLGRRFRKMGIAAERVPLRWWVRDWIHDSAFARGLERRVKRLVDHIRRRQPDLVLTNTSAVVEGALAASACGVPHIWYVHELLSRDPVLKPFLPLARFYEILVSLSEKVIAVSHCVRDEIAGHVSAEKIVCVPTGIPALEPRQSRASQRELLGIPAESQVVSFVGLLSKRKGVLDFVEAARQVHQRHAHTHFLIVGRDGGQSRQVLRKIDQHGLRSTVRWLGPRDDVADILAATDVFALPSLADPLPLAVLEAMSLGLPVVATRNGGCEEMVVDGQTGYLTPVRDPVALAAGISQLVADEPARRAMGQCGRARFVNVFSQAAYLKSMSGIIDSVVAEAAQLPKSPADIMPLMAELVHAATDRRNRQLARASLGERAKQRLLTALYACGAVR